MKWLLIIIFIVLQIFSIAQNLVPNPSFEDTLWCPYNTGQINVARHWFAPDYGGGGGSSELFHVCRTQFIRHGRLGLSVYQITLLVINTRKPVMHMQVQQC